MGDAADHSVNNQGTYREGNTERCRRRGDPSPRLELAAQNDDPLNCADRKARNSAEYGEAECPPQDTKVDDIRPVT